MVSLSYWGKPILKYRSRISKAIVTLLLTYLGRTAIFAQQKLYTLTQLQVFYTYNISHYNNDRPSNRWSFHRYGAILNNPPVAWCVRQSPDQTNLYFFFVPFTRRASVAPNAIRMLLLIHPLWFIWSATVLYQLLDDFLDHQWQSLQYSRTPSTAVDGIMA